MSRLVSIILVAALVGLDQWSKALVEQFLPLHQSEAFIPFLSFYRTYNEGIAFSGLDFIGNNVLTVLILVIVGFVIWLWSQLEKNRLFSHLGFAFIIAGALGNLIDRITLGHVIDFIQFHTQTWSFAIFNLADSFITIGAGLIIIDEIRQALLAKSGAENE